MGERKEKKKEIYENKKRRLKGPPPNSTPQTPRFPDTKVNPPLWYPPYINGPLFGYGFFVCV